MSNSAQFLAYAAAFEQAFATDDWSKVEPFFTPDAVYETPGGPPFGGRHEGRAAILAHFKRDLNRFDRRFDSRHVELLAGPEETEGVVWIRWAATYRLAGAPDLRVEGEERAFFSGDQIRRLEDQIPAAIAERVLAYMTQHGPQLTARS